ncbi:MAG TPA: AMP-dependent synthetase/ligase [Baekduia sp.]|uniref:AMP-dependent synthetase/ligase n=1 Tax=Baekduia sp. TaxID=2600305 RepID=UPI002D78F75F|nr:AMP-dependent synthetase/ligase [Baekduia sp.]HET6507924.1 AMP-dependent synthetase/ligase [Baekduia sp.]
MSDLRPAIDAALRAPTLVAAFQTIAPAYGDRVALRGFDTDEVVTWARYARRVEAAARGLHALGVRPGDPVALLLRNRPLFHVVDLAALHLGAIPFSLYHTEPAEQLTELVANAGARVLVGEEHFGERLRAVSVEHLVLDAERELEARGDGDDLDFEAAWRAVTPEHVATLVHTSGTTGASKAVQIPHRAIMSGASGAEALAPSTPGQTTVSFLPNAHISDRFMCHYMTMVLGGTTVCVADHEHLWDAIAATRPTRFHGVPRTFEKLAEQAKAYISSERPELAAAVDVGLARVRAQQSGEAVVDAEAARAADAALAVVRERLGLDAVQWLSVAAAPSSYAVLEYHHALGLPLAELWGMTEFMMAIMNPPARIKLGTVGVPLPQVEARVAEDGELLLRGPNACAGYRDDPRKTAEMLDADGWVHSGDLAAVDEDGYVRIVGRKKEQMINSSGKNMTPAKIEAAILEASPLLGWVVAIGDRRRFVSALIVLDDAALEAFARERGLDGDVAALAAHPDVAAEVRRAIAAGNAHLARVEQVRAWTVLPTHWRAGDDEVTNTHKLRRRVIDEKYATVIEEHYR